MPPHIRPLTDTPLPTVVSAFVAAFSDYLVQLPSEVSYWEQRFKAARVDWGLSFGVFEDDRLVAFIIQGIDYFHGQLTAFNTGTGVLPSHRGRGLVDALYAHALPLLRARGVTRCALEVITENARAIRVYERIGFAQMRRVCCFKGTLQAPFGQVQVRRVSLSEIQRADLAGRSRDSWDNTDQAIAALGEDYHGYEAMLDVHSVGYFVIHPTSHYLPRLEVNDASAPHAWDLLLQAVALVCATPRLNNIDATREDMILALQRAGLVNVIDQFELVMPI